jgi:3-dehydroquinate synthase
LKKITVDLKNTAYKKSTIHIGDSSFAEIDKHFAKEKISRKSVVFIDENVKNIFLPYLKKIFVEKNFEYSLITIAASESSKSLESASRIYTELLQLGADRTTTFIAFGGGVTGDLTGFIAASFHRGVPLVQVPTTLLAMVDSSIGGKVGINHKLGKNLIGFFYQPKLVVMDTKFLQSLPKREVMSGLSEVLKYGITFDEKFFDMFAADFTKIVAMDKSILEKIIIKSVQIKIAIIKEDEQDNGARNLLNFGHTFGHALELSASYDTLRHGEAVLIGMACAAFLSHEKKHLPLADLEKIKHIIKRFALDADLVKKGFLKISDDIILQNMKLDKKAANKKIRFVLLKKIGEGFLSSDVSEPEIKRALHLAREFFAS